ncbi:MAG TPA: DUF2935 domain-containing protein [Mobilitalea sp.]|nr:DUF2935 domain-containing protein [Mobilitalea sp.]
MEINSFVDNKLSEHRFWLQIMGDHARFIFFSLAPTESELITLAQQFILLFDQLLNQSHKQLSETEVHELNRKAYEATYRLREFKLELLSMSLTPELKSSLSSSFINGMINELEEYMFILNSLMNGQNPLLHPLHYHMLWLSDAASHAATLAATSDYVEKNIIDQSYRYEIQFQDLFLKAMTMNGYLRTMLTTFPSLEKLNEQANNAISSFMEHLETLRDQRMDGKVLGSMMPLLADHMSREECYYLWKLSQSVNNVKKPECDPSRPRLEK